MATVSRPAVRSGLPAIGPLVIAAACTLISVVTVAALLPTSPGGIAVPIRVAQVVDTATPSDEASAGQTSTVKELPHVVIGLGGAPVVALRGSTLERVASGALDSSGNAYLRLRAAPYVVCVMLPGQLAVTQPGGAISPLGRPPRSRGGCANR